MQRNEWDNPDPSGVNPVRRTHFWRPFIVVAVVIGLLGGSLIIPVPSTLLFVPGPVRDVEGLVEVDGENTYSSQGRLYMTTVSVDDYVTVAEWVMSAFDPSVTAVSEESFTQGLSPERLEEIQKAQMAESKSAAAVVALDALGMKTPQGAGTSVTQVLSEPARGDLEAGDVILSVEGEATGHFCDLISVLMARKPGDDVELEVRRGGRSQKIELELGEDPQIPGRAIIGVELERTFDPGFDYEFKTGRIAGPSAGLMFALALHDRLTPEDLTGGRTIAGTGTIACDGTVGAIGGIEQKVASAEDEGAEVFLAPAGNAAAAERIADDIDVVSVERFEDALEYLQDLD